MSSRYCEICNTITFDDELECDCNSPEKKEERERYRQEQIHKQFEWEIKTGWRGKTKKESQKELT
jgi:hypothetical protein